MQRVTSHLLSSCKELLVACFLNETSDRPYNLLDFNKYEDINEGWVGHDAPQAMERVHDLFSLSYRP